MNFRTLFTIGAISFPLAVTAQERPRVIEEIVVTAQKTEQSIQDVPISLSVLGADFLEEQNVTDFRDISLYVPNVTIDNNLQVSDVRIRGIGSTFGQTAFEQPVGLVIDGIPYGRLAYFRGPLFDLARVEALRGPQGTLFGKNTTAGLLNVVTAQPTDELTATLTMEFGELDRARLTAAIGGSIIPGVLQFRIAGLSEERDGFMTNTTAAVVEGLADSSGGRTRRGVRLQLAAPDLMGASFNLSVERVETDLVGTAFEYLIVDEAVQPFLRQFDPNADFEPNNRVTSVDHPTTSFTDIDTVTFNMATELMGWDVFGVAGYSEVDSSRRTDVDFGPAPMLWSAPNSDPANQATGELRASRAGIPGFFGLPSLFGFSLGSTDATFGVFYQRRTLENMQKIQADVPVLAAFIASQQSGTIFPIDPTTTQMVFGEDAGLEEISNQFREVSNAYAPFGQFDWHLTDRFTLVAGLRFSRENKEGDFGKSFTSGTGLAFGVLAAQEEFQATRSRSESAFTPKVSGTYAWSDALTVYAGWARGFKAGGFNAQVSNDNIDENFAFDRETASSFEAGAKASLLGGAARINVGIFRHSVNDLQVFTTQPSNLEIQVVNVGRALTQGVELDTTWLPHDWVTLAGALAFTDSEFLEFPLGSCSGDRANTDGDEDERCDLTGQPFLRTPKWTSTVTGTLRVPVESFAPSFESALAGTPFAGMEVSLGGSAEYWDTHFVADTFDPRVRQPRFFRYGASFGLESVSGGWSLRLIGKNLSDEDIIVAARDVPLAAGNFVQIPDPPRLFFGSFLYRF